MIRVYLIAASALARSGLENLLAGRGVSLVGSSGGSDVVHEDALEAGADVVLLHAADGNVLPLAETLAASQLASEVTVAVLVDGTPSSGVTDLVRAGVRAILPARISREQLLSALQAAVAGLLVLDPADVRSLLPEPALTASALTELAEPLTPREREVLQMLASGLANKEIAAKLSISDHTQVSRGLDSRQAGRRHQDGSRRHRHPPRLGVALTWESTIRSPFFPRRNGDL